MNTQIKGFRRRGYGRLVIQHGVRPVQPDSGRSDILISDQFGLLELMDADAEQCIMVAGYRVWDDLKPVILALGWLCSGSGGRQELGTGGGGTIHSGTLGVGQRFFGAEVTGMR